MENKQVCLNKTRIVRNKGFDFLKMLADWLLRIGLGVFGSPCAAARQDAEARRPISCCNSFPTGWNASPLGECTTAADWYPMMQSPGGLTAHGEPNTLKPKFRKIQKSVAMSIALPPPLLHYYKIITHSIWPQPVALWARCGSFISLVWLPAPATHILSC